MARIRIKDLPRDQKVTKEELNMIWGGTILATGMLTEPESNELQYFNLQSKMQMENRQFTMISNIMKVKHDTDEAAISNVR